MYCSYGSDVDGRLFDTVCFTGFHSLFREFHFYLLTAHPWPLIIPVVAVVCFIGQ